MAISFPTSLDNFTNPLGTQTLDSPDHAGQHSDANDALEALEAKIGVGAGTPTANKILVGSGNGTATWNTTWNGGTIGTAAISASTIGTSTITGGTIISSTLAGTPVLDANSAVPFYIDSIFRQALINGNFDVSQRATTFVSGANNDDVYTLDRWNLFSDGNDVFDVSQEAITDLPGSTYAIKLDVETAKRGGIAQFIEFKDAIKYKGKYCSLSFAVKSANITALRAAVLSWGSTADTITSDIVGTWAATPTWAANWTAENTPADLTVTSSWTTVKIENIYIDSATVNNLAVAIWTPGEETIGDIVYITQVQLNEGATALPFMPKSYVQELADCQRYCYVPNTAEIYSTVAFGMSPANNLVFAFINYPVEMRIKPSLTATASDWQAVDGASATDLTSIENTTESTGNTRTMGEFRCGVSGTPLTQYRPYYIRADGSANRLMIFNAEL